MTNELPTVVVVSPGLDYDDDGHPELDDFTAALQWGERGGWMLSYHLRGRHWPLRQHLLGGTETGQDDAVGEAEAHLLWLIERTPGTNPQADRLRDTILDQLSAEGAADQAMQAQVAAVAAWIGDGGTWDEVATVLRRAEAGRDWNAASAKRSFSTFVR